MSSVLLFSADRPKCPGFSASRSRTRTTRVPPFTTKPAGAGTGLGLSTVSGIAAQRGGHTRFDTTPGAGTRFHVYLPESLERALTASRDQRRRLGSRHDAVGYCTPRRG